MESDIPLKVLMSKENMKKIRKSGKEKVKPGEELFITTKKKAKLTKKPRKRVDTGLDQIREKREKRRKKQEQRLKAKKKADEQRKINKRKLEAQKDKKLKKVFYDVNGAHKAKNNSLDDISRFSDKIGISVCEDSVIQEVYYK